MSDNSKTNCDGYGMFFWKTLEINEKEIPIKFKYVYLVTNLHQNILFLSAIFKQSSNATEIRRDDNNLLLKIRNNEIEFKLKENLFKNLVKSDSIIVNAVKTTKETCSMEKFTADHQKMAHLNSQDLASALRSQGFEISKNSWRQYNTWIVYSQRYCWPRAYLQ